jgi:HEAT repeat protein
MLMSLRSAAVGLLIAACLAVLADGCTRESKPDPRVAGLIKKLETGSIEEKTQAAEDLANLGPAASPAVPALVKNLGSGHSSTRYVLNINSTNALLRIGPRAALPALIEALKSDDLEIVNGAAITIGGFGRAARPAVPALLKTLQDQQTRESAKAALEMIQHD